MAQEHTGLIGKVDSRGDKAQVGTVKVGKSIKAENNIQ